MVVYCRCVEADMLMDPLLYHVTTDAGAADCQVVMTDDADDHSDCSATDLPDQVSFIYSRYVTLPLCIKLGERAFSSGSAALISLPADLRTLSTKVLTTQ